MRRLKTSRRGETTRKRHDGRPCGGGKEPLARGHLLLDVESIDAPEEFERGALIDERATVFTLGRTAAVLLSDGSLERPPFRSGDALHRVMERACRQDRHERFPAAAAFQAVWRETGVDR